MRTMLDERTALLEALLLVSGAGAEPSALARAAGMTEKQIEDTLETLDIHYRTEGHGLRVGRLGVFARLVTAPANGAAVARLTGADRPARLSAAALDTLAIIAYRQPITRIEIEKVRGVGCEHVLAVLLNGGLIEEAGRAESVGRPVLYATTAGFLQSAGLTRLEDLPPLPEA